MSDAGLQILRNRRVLVVEDDYLLAEEVAGLLSDLGTEILGPVGNLAEALVIAASETPIDVAILDVNVRGQKIWPVVDALRARGIPPVLATGYDADAIPAAYVELMRCEKPISMRTLTSTLSRALPGTLLKT